MSLVSKIIFLVVLLTSSAASEGSLEGRGPKKRFISQLYGFSMSVPVGWGVSTRLDTPVFFYAPASLRFIQDAIPQGGAVITTEPHDTVSGPRRSASTPEAWALADARAFAPSSPPIEPFVMPRESGASRAVTCSYDETTLSPDQHTQHSVAIFWEFDQKLFAAHLNYNASDSNGTSLEKIFSQTVRSIRPLGKHLP
jgi:hypothetical protein